MNAQQKRYFWTVLALLTTMLVIGLSALLFGCKSPKTESGTVVRVQVDTARLRLQQEKQAAKATAQQAHQRTYQTQQPYENSVSAYDSLRKLLAEPGSAPNVP